MNYIMDPFTDYVIEGAYQHAFRSASQRIKDYLANGIIFFETQGDSFTPICNGIMYPDIIPDKIADDYTQEEQERYDDILKNAKAPVRAINVYNVKSLLRNTIYLTKIYIDSSIFIGRDHLTIEIFEELKDQLDFLISNIDQIYRVEMIEKLDDFINYIPTMNNYYLVEAGGVETPWSSLISNRTLDSIREIIN